MSMSKTLNGKIIKGIGGFYYVEARSEERRVGKEC